MRGVALALISAIVSAAACSGGPAADRPGQEVEKGRVLLLSARAPETIIALGVHDGKPILIDVVPQPSVPGSGATIAIFADDANDAFQRITLYPADRPARFIVRVPSSATFIRLRLEAIGKAPLPDVEVSLAHKPVEQ